jgi:hypothetical protein
MLCPLIELWKIPLLARAYINPQSYASQALNDSVPSVPPTRAFCRAGYPFSRLANGLVQQAAHVLAQGPQ